MPLRYVITKASGQGEQITMSVEQCNPITGLPMHTNAELSQLVDEALVVSDMRLEEMNTRMLEAYGLEEYCTPQEWAKVSSILEVLSGRMSAATLQHRWQSEKEETAALEQGRAEAAAKAESERLNTTDKKPITSKVADLKATQPQPRQQELPMPMTEQQIEAVKPQQHQASRSDSEKV